MPTTAQLDAVRALIGSAPDTVLSGMSAALAEAGDQFASIVDQIETERRDRRVRDLVLSPILPLFEPRRDGVSAPAFPRGLLSALWAAVRATDPEGVALAALASRSWRSDEDAPPRVFDDLCRVAARLVRHEPAPAFQGAAAQDLGPYLSLAPFGRQAIARLPDWLGKATDERAAGLRLIFKDAVDVVEDSAPRLLEMMLGHMSEAWLVLRPISLLTERAGDRYLSGSELASFGERLLVEAERRVARLKTFDARGGAAAARSLAADVHMVSAILAEFEQAIDLTRDGPWGRRVGEARKAVAALIESRLRDTQKAVEAALPMQVVRLTGRMTRPAPKVSSPPDPRLIEPARALLTLLRETRQAAATGGYGALRGHVSEGLAEFLEIYADELVHLLNAGEAPDPDIAQAYLELAAEFLSLSENDKAAQVVRRRAAVAGAGSPSQHVA